MASPGEHEGQGRKALVARSVLQQNREFFDQFFNRVVKTRFRVASDESAARQMTIVIGSCTAARCQLMANGHTMVLTAAHMASTAPEIQFTYGAPENSDRAGVERRLQYQPPAGWLDPE